MTGPDLDYFLSIGYFRMHQNVFTCNFLLKDDVPYPVHWLRVAIGRVAFGKSQRELLKRNRAFAVTARPFALTTELQTLYARYRNSIDFDTYLSLEEALYGGPPYTTFDTYLIEIRDGNRLIAAGVFDNGNHSMAGIINVYDPDYRKYSLGKLLMLEKIRFAQQQQKHYYYPGYIVTGYPKFDYKLHAAEPATELYDARYDEWLPFRWETVRAIATEMMRE
jgi:leucyl-tRNA---protein transferase